MVNIDPNTTLAQLVIENPALAAPMEKLGFDYCCGGQIPLNDAVLEAGLDIDEVISNFENATEDKADLDWAKMNIGQLVDNILSVHHEYLHEELPRLCDLADKVASVHGSNHPELLDVAKLVYEVRDDMGPHMRKEEMMLFPLARQISTSDSLPKLPFGTFANPIKMMSAEHEVTGAILLELRKTTNNFALPKDACVSYQALYQGLEAMEKDTHLHIHRENNILFPSTLAKEQELSEPNKIS